MGQNAEQYRFLSGIAPKNSCFFEKISKNACILLIFVVYLIKYINS